MKPKPKPKVLLRSHRVDGQVIFDIDGRVYEYWLDAAHLPYILHIDRYSPLKAFVLTRKMAREEKRREDLEA